MSLLTRNSLHMQAAKGTVCKAFNIRWTTNILVGQLAQSIGFDALIIDTTSSPLDLYMMTNEAGSICNYAVQTGITPFVRVPYQCDGSLVDIMLQQGAMGIVFPRIDSKGDAEAAVRITKYPPTGCRPPPEYPTLSILFDLFPIPGEMIFEETNSHGSSVFVMIETKDSIENIEEIAAVEGVEVLQLVGSIDLAIKLGVRGKFHSVEFRGALEKVSRACKKYGKIFGIADIYHVPEIQTWALNTLGARFGVSPSDLALIAEGGREYANTVSEVFKPWKVEPE